MGHYCIVLFCDVCDILTGVARFMVVMVILILFFSVFWSILKADLYVVKIVAGERGNCACRKFLGIDVAIAQNKVSYVKLKLISDKFILLGSLLQRLLIVLCFP